MKDLRSSIMKLWFWLFLSAILNGVQAYNSNKLEKRIVSLESLSYEKLR